jgi:hypothetical protein
MQPGMVLHDIIHGHLKGFYFLKFMYIYFVFYSSKKDDPGGVDLHGEQKNLLWRPHVLWRISPCAPQKVLFLWRTLAGAP